MNRIALTSLAMVGLVACSSFPFFGKRAVHKAHCSEKAEKRVEDSRRYSRAKLEMHDIRYDGRYLFGRLLISPMDGPIRVDRRIISTRDVDVESVRDCRTGERINHMKVDILPPGTCEEDALLLEPGYWYGGGVRFALFAPGFTGMGPECIEVGLALLSFDRKFVGHMFARATRVLPSATDGGTPGDSPPAMDGGSPDAGAEGMP
ncbi:MAG: hypothetical protein JXB05_12870 [Myxococcaceae bacterium]|nr:hypothetical protein [Myxococcaceae bacterium]